MGRMVYRCEMCSADHHVIEIADPISRGVKRWVACPATANPLRPQRFREEGGVVEKEEVA